MKLTSKHLAPVRTLIPTRGWSWPSFVLSMTGVAGFTLFWWLAVESPIAVTERIPGPVEVVLSARPIGLALLRHLAATTARAVVGFLGGAIIGIAAALALCYFRRAYVLLQGAIESMRPVPPVALVPFFLLIFGFSEVGRLLLVWIGVGLVFLVATVEAALDTPPHLVETHLTLGLRKWSIYRMVIAPQALYRLLGPARVALALSMALVVVSEFMGATYGLGHIINVAKVTFNTAAILLASMLLGIISGVLDALLRIAFDFATPWASRLDQGSPRPVA